MCADRSASFARFAARCLGRAGVDAAERDLCRFIRLAWPVVEPGTPFISGWHLDAVCEHLMAVSRGQIRNLLINMPPRHMKSLAVGVFWPAWEWTTAPARRWLFSSYALSLAQRDSLKCRRLIESAWYRRCWGERFALCGDQNTKLRYENDRSGHRITTSVGGAATGEGGDRVVVDDPHNVAERESQAIRTATLEWWDQTMSTRLNDPRTGAKVIVMQRVHEKDLSGHVLEQGGYVHLRLPAEFEPAKRCVTALPWQDPRSAEGELLWPQRIGPREIADLKLRLGPEGYAGQFQQRPAPAEGGAFKSAWFRYYEPVEDEQGAHYRLIGPNGERRTIAAAECQRIAVMDPAASEVAAGRNPCYTVIQVWDVSAAGEMILVHQYRRQVQAPDAAEAAASICRRFDASYIAIEKDGIGLGVVQQVRRCGIAVRAIKARGSKAARTQTAEIRMAAGAIYFPKSAPWLFDFEQELLQFPNSQFADQVDALAHAAMLCGKQFPSEPEREETPPPPDDDP